ncbi:MAG TPA: phosphoribosylamine--glycine ligase [Pyrodictium sp.]|nr:phosphoribosylamine--glycine ligase [Pyrodictium sp.]
MRVLLVGYGGREHALSIMIRDSPMSPKISVVMDKPNPGIRRVVEETGGKVYVAKTTDPLDVARAAERENPDLVVIGPEEPIFSGVVDALEERGFLVYGPKSRLGLIEKSKAYARELMWRHGIPGRLRYAAFRDVGEAMRYASLAGDVVVKPARQAGGRGVRVFAEPTEHLRGVAREAITEHIVRVARIVDEKYGDVDYKVVVEERVEGVEYTLMAITDGETVLGLPLVQDHPHLFEGDVGPETGGMGAIAGPSYTLPFINDEEYDETIDILKKTIDALKNETRERYKGTISGQMMLTALWGPTVIEYYARFGDPEIAALIPLIESDFLELLLRAAEGRLAGTKLRIKDSVYVVVKAVAPKGYPENRGLAKGHPVQFNLDAVSREGCLMLVAGVEEKNGVFYSTGSRLVEIVCASTQGYEDASRRADKAIVSGVELADGHPLVWRRDIGSRWLVEKRIELAKIVRQAYKNRKRRGVIVYDWVPGKGLIVYDYSSQHPPQLIPHDRK